MTHPISRRRAIANAAMLAVVVLVVAGCCDEDCSDRVNVSGALDYRPDISGSQQLDVMACLNGRCAQATLEADDDQTIGSNPQVRVTTRRPLARSQQLFVEFLTIGNGGDTYRVRAASSVDMFAMDESFFVDEYEEIETCGGDCRFAEFRL